MSEDKPKEFWILPWMNDFEPQVHDTYKSAFECTDPEKIVHVIEKSAYDKAIEGLKRMEVGTPHVVCLSMDQKLIQESFKNEARNILRELGEI